MKYFLIIILVLVLIFIVAYGLYCFLTYIDETITVGKGYGFTIGDSKEETYQKAKKNYENKTVFILHPIDHRGYGPHKKFTFSPEEYSLISELDSWTFYFTDDYFDLIQLKFEDSNLVEIHRHRKKFELP